MAAAPHRLHRPPKHTHRPPVTDLPYLFTGRSSAPSWYMLEEPSYTWSVDRCTNTGVLHPGEGQERWFGVGGAQRQRPCSCSGRVAAHLPWRAAWRCTADSSWVGMLMARAAASPSPSHAAGAACAAQLMTLQGEECWEARGVSRGCRVAAAGASWPKMQLLQGACAHSSLCAHAVSGPSASRHSCRPSPEARSTCTDRPGRQGNACPAGLPQLAPRREDGCATQSETRPCCSTAAAHLEDLDIALKPWLLPCQVGRPNLHRLSEAAAGSGRRRERWGGRGGHRRGAGSPTDAPELACQPRRA